MEQDPPSTFIRPCKRQDNLASSSRPLIPGPAGAVQAAMIHRRSTDDKPNISTQQFVRQVLQDGHDTDPDFQSNAWLSALQLNGSATPLGAITHHHERVDHVIGVIKSCNPNGFGDATVTLKDPTGTVGASIHHKVFTESVFAKDITVGSVLLLQKVAVFSPRKSNCYLNITLSNVVKVFSKDSAPPPGSFTNITED
ncbi:uncharacterized protein LOC130739859 [Lotus japonicus]|uniref:uncharacterized protein LOC130719475 n=3 Tax=Lotus japonicus TaxID=34305 RepID=UPI002585F06E|nr:uncharacterized protein LOC130719475 [Lotus japonicus]XP_057428303.1 uncharacterized protein LOC130721517 [Lotus japonicus]XP_057441472.1 uncharacterized protein LOC130733343 [Lotus japonicus]XP_057442185.1 uncharacterized protein LOC130733912 [Lotus japonicus]XP_057445516.1 uncharacterized protein LOC130737708 [Lotus japonicus]XP_057448282.1 uncharacterized protein LOC130739859 [Lotus japonicus]